MATRTWEDVITDKSNFPDDTVLKLADGTEVRLGDVRPGYMKDADYRQKTSLLARQREAFEAQAVQQMQAIQEGEAQLRAIATELVRQNPGMTKKEVAEELSSDPEVARLKNEIAELKTVVKPLADYITNFDASSKQARQNYVVNEHKKALLDLKAQDPSLDEAALVQYAKDNYIPNLRAAYKLMTYDTALENKAKTTREEAFKEGYEKAKVEVTAPALIPMRSVLAPKEEGAPKNWREVMDKALRDPEVMNPLLGRQV